MHQYKGGEYCDQCWNHYHNSRDSCAAYILKILGDYAYGNFDEVACYESHRRYSYAALQNSMYEMGQDLEDARVSTWTWVWVDNAKNGSFVHAYDEDSVRFQVLSAYSPGTDLHEMLFVIKDLEHINDIGTIFYRKK